MKILLKTVEVIKRQQHYIKQYIHNLVLTDFRNVC